MVCVATLVEYLCSIAWGAYEYRLGNLPLYVPAGHGLLYLMAIRVSQLPFIIRHERIIIRSVFGTGTAHLFFNLFFIPQPDLSGLINWFIFLPFIFRSPFALLYGVSFTLTMGLEFYGTNLGTWEWRPVLPFLGIAASNPPACIGAGYCVLDVISRLLAQHAKKILGRRLPIDQPVEIQP